MVKQDMQEPAGFQSALDGIQWQIPPKTHVLSDCRCSTNSCSSRGVRSTSSFPVCDGGQCSISFKSVASVLHLLGRDASVRLCTRAGND